MSEEIFDIVNERDEVIGQAPRKEVHARGLWHRAIHVLVFNSRGDFLLLACQDGTARLWDVARDEELRPSGGMRHGYPVTAAAFDPLHNA